MVQVNQWQEGKHVICCEVLLECILALHFCVIVWPLTHRSHEVSLSCLKHLWKCSCALLYTVCIIWKCWFMCMLSKHVWQNKHLPQTSLPRLGPHCKRLQCCSVGRSSRGLSLAVPRWRGKKCRHTLQKVEYHAARIEREVHVSWYSLHTAFFVVVEGRSWCHPSYTQGSVQGGESHLSQCSGWQRRGSALCPAAPGRWGQCDQCVHVSMVRDLQKGIGLWWPETSPLLSHVGTETYACTHSVHGGGIVPSRSQRS